MRLSGFCFGKHLGTLWEGFQKVTKRLFRLQEWLGCCSGMASTGKLEEETLSMKGPHFKYLDAFRATGNQSLPTWAWELSISNIQDMHMST